MKTSATLFRTKIATLFLVISLAGGVLCIPMAARAQPLPVIDVVQVPVQKLGLVQNIISAVNSAADHTLSYILNTLAWQVANLAIDSMVKSLVNWINSGFEGSPAFATDLNKNLQGVGDAMASRFFEELSAQKIAKTPFQDKVLDAVRLGYYLSTSPESFYEKNPYTLNQVSSDDRAFLAGDFSKGGWNAWFATVMNPQNNPYGSELLYKEALSNTVANATGNRLQELSWNKGFLSWRGECTKYEGGNQTLNTAPVCTTTASGELECTSGPTTVVSLDGKEKCIENEIETPGSVIMEAANKGSFAGLDRIMNADQFNEIIGALLNQLVKQVLGGGEGGGGFRSLSKPAVGGGTSFLDTATNPANGDPVANIGSTFTATVQAQRKFVDDYRLAWEKIRTAAEAAKLACGTSTTASPTPDEVIERANTALARAANALAALDEILDEIKTSAAQGGDQTLPLFDVSTKYNALTSCAPDPTQTTGTGCVLPAAEDITEAQTESQDTGTTDPGSLFSQMTRLAASSSCTLGT